jgi:UDP-N-acetylmuramoyl-tripeptide--D-alanyl-D-alanine ligase
VPEKRYKFLTKKLLDRLSLIQNLPLWLLAFIWRTLLIRTTVIAITGSVGKTTATQIIASILSTHGPTVATEGTRNGRGGQVRTVLSARRRHRYLVVEAGTDRRGGIVRASLLLRPDIVVILSVARTHTDAFHSLEDTAREKAQLMRFMRKNGTVILNRADPRVAAMAAQAPGKVITFGQNEIADVSTRDAEASFPDRLHMTVSASGQTLPVKTQLVGAHWVPSVLAGITVAVSCGVPLDQVPAAIGEVLPVPGRLSPETLPNGAVLLRDEYNSSADTLYPAIQVLQSARASRKFLIISDVSDLKKRDRLRLNHCARLAAQAAGFAVFVGDKSPYAVEAAIREGMDPSRVYAAFTAEAAASWLKERLQPGDLVLLRNRHDDHLERVFFRLKGEVACSKSKCTLRQLCDDCPELGFRPLEGVAPLVNVQASAP